MKYFFGGILFLAIVSCKRDEKTKEDDFVKFSLRDKQINIVGSITFFPDDIIDYDKSTKYTIKCGVDFTNYSDPTKDEANLLLSIPVFNKYINDTLIEKKYPIIEYSCGVLDKIDQPFILSLNLYLNNVNYIIVDKPGDSRFYNRITKITHLGLYYNSQTDELYEVEGEFKVCFVNMNKTPYDSIFVNDGKYKVQMVSYNDKYK